MCHNHYKENFNGWYSQPVRWYRISGRVVQLNRAVCHERPLFTTSPVDYGLTAQAVKRAMQGAWKKEKSRTVRIGLKGIYNSLMDQPCDALIEKYGINRSQLNACVSRARQRLKPFLEKEGIETRN